MLVNNFYTLMQTIFIAGCSSKDISFPFVKYNGAVVQKYANEIGGYGVMCFSLYEKSVYKNDSAGKSFAPNNSCIAIGSGAGAVTTNDYTLQSPITYGFSCISSCSLEKSDGYPVQVNTLVITNTQSSGNLTIAEIGLFWNAGFMLDRTVLDTPVTISPGQVATIKYRITNASVLNT